MDPVTAVGVASNIVSILELTARLFNGLFEYYYSVKQAPDKSKELREELLVLSDLLKDAKLNLEPAGGSANSLQNVEALYEGLRQLKEMLMEMDRRIAGSFNITGRVKWPFTQRENEQYISRIERYKCTFVVALSLNQKYTPTNV